MDDKMTDIKYVQLESADFLSDPDFQLMTSKERGIYCSVIFYMYLNDGKILNDSNRIRKLCNVDVDFEKSWKVVQKKFTEKNGYLTHKRVRKELLKAKKFIQRQRRAGLASGKARQPRLNHGSTTEPTMVEPSKVKESKGKVNKEKICIYTLQQCKDSAILSGLTEQDAEHYYNHFNSQGWVKSNNQPITNLRSHMAEWRVNKPNFEKREQNDKNRKATANRGNPKRNLR